jgi:hypothetical protein
MPPTRAPRLTYTVGAAIRTYPSSLTTFEARWESPSRPRRQFSSLTSKTTYGRRHESTFLAPWIASFL